MQLIVIGISGITGGGKSTLATRLLPFLSDPNHADIFDGVHINKVVLINQDKYFYVRDSPNHTWIPEINFINREILSAMNMDQFAADVADTVDKLRENDVSNGNAAPTDAQNARVVVNILLIEGFLIYNDERINRFCELRFHIYLSYDVGLQRRLKRNFKHINPKPEWYFEHFIWPMYQKHLSEVPNKTDLIYLNGEQHVDDVFHQARDAIAKFLQTKCNTI